MRTEDWKQGRMDGWKNGRRRLGRSLALQVVSLTTSYWLLTTAALAQGPLTPPGSPAPTFKTLEQIEPRTPIGTNTTPGDVSSLFKITQSGSYYLTTNIVGEASKNGIEIAASGVSLDLMGFDLLGVPDSQAGVRASAAITNVAIRNGSIRNWGGNGVDCSDTANGQITGVRVVGNGTGGGFAGGIKAGRCYVVSDCTATANEYHGINVHDGSTVVNCTARANKNNGIETDGVGCTFRDCTVTANVGNGIRVGGHCLLVGNTCNGNGAGAGNGAGIAVGSEGNRIDSNNVIDNDQGIRVTSGPNIIIRNTAKNNAVTDFDIAGGNKVGPTNDLFDANGVITNTNPWANFSF